MTREWELGQASFDCLLRVLAPDREHAAQEYEALRARLAKFFEWRQCPSPDDLADRTLDRLARRLEGGAQVEQVYSYCCGIARLLILEEQRAVERQAGVTNHVAASQTPVRGTGNLSETLRDCLERLPLRSRRLVLAYYEEDRLAKIEKRKQLAISLNVPLSALRLRAFRIRSWLENCVEKSLEDRNGLPKQVTQK